jgi:PAS domain S-box-containing protein
VLEQLGTILRQILSAQKPNKPAVGEHRGAQRYALRAKVTVQIALPGAAEGRRSIGMWLRDISSAGVGLMHTEEMPLGQEMLIDIPDLGDLAPLVAVVKRCEMMSKDIYVVGAAFVTGAKGLSATPPAEKTLTSGQVTRVAAQASVRNETAPANPAAAALAVADQVRKASAFSTTPTKLVTLDRRFIWVNPAFASLVGRSPFEMAGQSIDLFTHRDDARVDVPLVQRMIAGSLASSQATKRYLHRNGSSVSITWTNVLLRDIASRPLFLLATADPPSQRQSAAQTINEAERIRRAMFE